MQNTKIDFVKVKKLAKVILTSSLELIGVFAIYLINLARAILNKTLDSFVSLINNPFTFSISLQSKNSEIVLNKRASISSISKYLMIFGLIFILVAAMFSVAINAADPGHGASVIGSGTFESGTYTFPLNLIINHELRSGTGNISGNLYVNNGTLINTWLYNGSNYSSKELHGAYSIYWNNESGSYASITWAYNQTSAIVWNDLRNYPVACSADTYITQIDDTVTCTSVAFNFNQTTNYLQINSSTVAGLNNESGSYSPVKFGYNMSDNAQLLFNYNQTTASNTYADNNFISSTVGNRTYVKLSDANNTYAINTSLAQFAGSNNQFLYNQTTGSFNQYGVYWYNQSDNAQLLFNYNQSQASESQFGKFWYNMSDGGADGNNDNLNNVAFVNNSNLFTSQNNFTFNLGASIYAMNWSNVSIFRSQIRDNLANESSTYLQINSSTRNALVNESGSYAPIKFGYNNSLATQNNFGEFWYNQSAGSLDQYGKFWINQTASFTYTGTGDTVKENSPTIGGTWAGAVTFSGIHTHSVNITMNSNLTFNNKNDGITFNTASRIFDNGTCLIIKGRTSVIEVC